MRGLGQKPHETQELLSLALSHRFMTNNEMTVMLRPKIWANLLDSIITTHFNASWGTSVILASHCALSCSKHAVGFSGPLLHRTVFSDVTHRSTSPLFSVCNTVCFYLLIHFVIDRQLSCCSEWCGCDYLSVCISVEYCHS